MATLLTEGRYASDWLKNYDPTRSLEEVVIASGAGVVVTGTVLGKITASGKYVPVTVAATDGSSHDEAAAIFAWGDGHAQKVDATSADVTVVAVVREATVVHQGLKYGADVDASAERAAVHAALGAINGPILVREGA